MRFPASDDTRLAARRYVAPGTGRRRLRYLMLLHGNAPLG